MRAILAHSPFTVFVSFRSFQFYRFGFVKALTWKIPVKPMVLIGRDPSIWETVNGKSSSEVYLNLFFFFESEHFRLESTDGWKFEKTKN